MFEAKAAKKAEKSLAQVALMDAVGKVDQAVHASVCDHPRLAAGKPRIVGSREASVARRVPLWLAAQKSTLLGVMVCQNCVGRYLELECCVGVCSEQTEEAGSCFAMAMHDS